MGAKRSVPLLLLTLLVVVLLLPEGTAVVGTILGVQANKGPPMCNAVDPFFDEETSNGCVVVVVVLRVVEVVGEAPVSFALALATFRFDGAAIIVSLGVRRLNGFRCNNTKIM